MKYILVSLLTIVIFGCTSISGLKQRDEFETNTSNHILHPYNKLQYLSCDNKSTFPEDPYASTSFKLDNKKFLAAKNNFVYALMSNNVYRDPSEKPIFAIPGWQGPIREVSNSGLVIELYEKIVEGKINEVAIAFKGTDFTSFKDWMANLSIYFEPTQYRESREFIENILKKESYSEAKIVTTGHSLGGGIAMNMSYLFEGIDSVGFNTSPRAFYSANKKLKNNVTMITENGEVLKALRTIWRRKLKSVESIVFDFMDFRIWTGQSVQEHSIYFLSRGLLLAAQSEKNDYARQVFKENFEHNDLSLAFKSSKNKERDIEYCQKLLN